MYRQMNRLTAVAVVGVDDKNGDSGDDVEDDGYDRSVSVSGFEPLELAEKTIEVQRGHYTGHDDAIDFHRIERLAT